MLQQSFMARLETLAAAPAADLSALGAGCAAPVSANEVERGSGIQERVAGRLDTIHSGNRVENDLALGDVSFRNQVVQLDRAEFQERTLVRPMDGGIVDHVSIRGYLNHNAHLDRAARDSVIDFLEEKIRAPGWLSLLLN